MSMAPQSEPETEEEPREIIKKEAQKEGLSPWVMTEIARCESTFRPEVENDHSSATGLFQIIDGTWEYYQCKGSRKNPTDNARCAMKIASQSGLHHWDASRHCWG